MLWCLLGRETGFPSGRLEMIHNPEGKEENIPTTKVRLKCVFSRKYTGENIEIALVSSSFVQMEQLGSSDPG